MYLELIGGFVIRVCELRSGIPGMFFPWLSSLPLRRELLLSTWSHSSINSTYYFSKLMEIRVYCSELLILNGGKVSSYGIYSNFELTLGRTGGRDRELRLRVLTFACRLHICENKQFCWHGPLPCLKIVEKIFWKWQGWANALFQYEIGREKSTIWIMIWDLFHSSQIILK